ncbi:MAG TPA: pyridoxal-dependent decarboxylase, partial [Oscillatoriaceae cyanobacterium]
VARTADLSVPIAGADLRTLSPWQLMNLPGAEVLALRERLLALAAERPAIARALREGELGARGLIGFHSRFAALYGEPLALPVVLAPSTAHYSWIKIVDLLGLGRTQLVSLPVDAHYRVDADRFFETLVDLAQRDVPVLATVAVLGATETGALDPLEDLRAAASEPECRELHFHWHVDAAYGGYATAMYRDAQGAWTDGPSFAAANARHFRALMTSDSITIDPHKLGYAHYPAGAVVYADNRVRELLASDAPYVFHDDAPHGQSLGRYIVEGSKPGAAAAAVWLCHQVTPLDETGYGALIGPTCAAAQELHASLAAYRSPEGFRLIPLNTPDLNLVVFLAVPPDVRSLAALNHFNEALFAHFTTAPDRLVFSHAFLFSKTDLEIDVYGAGLRARLDPDLARLLHEGESLCVLRSTVMNPFVPQAIAEGPYLEDLLTALESGMRAVQPLGRL